MSRSALLLVALTLAAALPSFAEDSRPYLVIVHEENPREQISEGRLSRLFLKRVTKWEDGSPVLPVDLDERSDLREEFSLDVHDRRTASIKSFWQRMIFSGRDTPPPEVDDEEDVIEYVRSRPGAIGYVSAESPREELEEVKILRVVERRAGSGSASALRRSHSKSPS